MARHEHYCNLSRRRARARHTKPLQTQKIESMKIKSRAPYETCLMLAFITSIILIISGCNIVEPYPSKENFSHYLPRGCTLVSVEDFERLPDDMGFERIEFRYQADCIPEGGKAPIRIHASQQFNQYNEWGTTKWVAQERKYLPDPNATMSASITTAATALPALPFSDAPECNARVQRMVDEVLPCLKAQKPDLVQPLQDQIELQKTRFRFHGEQIDRGPRLLEMEKRCAEYWHQVNMYLPSGSAPGACALKD
jgi:hypothetical protein